MAKKQLPVIALDIETERARYGTRPDPICVCLYSDELHITQYFWGADCIKESQSWLAKYKQKCLIIAHNGGKFDFGYYMPDAGDIRVIGSRILEGLLAGHKTLDTFLLMPTALKNLGTKEEGKLTTDLDTHRLDCSQEERQKILDYCMRDCQVLLRAYRRFCKVFKNDEFVHCRPTAAGNAFAELKAATPNGASTLYKTTYEFDSKFRPFYHGGIVHTFGPARDLTGKFTMVDANSMYPAAMRNYNHPGSNRYIQVEKPVITKAGALKGFGDKVWFIEFEGWGKLLPLQTQEGLVYGKTGRYFVSCHELAASAKYGMVRIDKICNVYLFTDSQTFAPFVDKFYSLRMECKAVGDAVEYVYKIVLNSAYGKFGQNPDNYKKVCTTFERIKPDTLKDHDEWEFESYSDETGLCYWTCKSNIETQSFVNVAVAASITGAARATLIEAIGAVQSAGGTVHYCDTDSIVFEGEATMNLGAQLGQWKVECELDRLVIAAPKLYALLKDDGKWKVASKGVRATAKQIIDLVSGLDDLVYYPEVGSHDYKGKYRTTPRRIKRDTIGVPHRAKL